MDPAWCGHHVLILKERVIRSFDISWKDDFNVISNPISLFLRLRSSPHIYARSFLSLSEFLLMPFNQLKT